MNDISMPVQAGAAELDRAAWLQERRSGIGGSDAPAVLGVSKWRTPYQVWQEKRGELVETPDNWSMRWGRVMEPELRQHYSDITGRDVLMPPTAIVRHPKHAFMIATPDGGTADGRLVEIKTSRSTDGWGMPGTDEIPPAYLVQVQHYMCVTGFRIADVVLGIYGSEPSIYHVEADDELHEMLIDAEAEFWKSVESGEPPEPTSYADVIARYGRKSVANAVIADRETVHAIESLRELNTQAKTLDAHIEACKADIMRALGEFDTLIDDAGHVLCTWKSAKPATRFDSKALQATHPDIYSQFLKAGESSRRFLIK